MTDIVARDLPIDASSGGLAAVSDASRLVSYALRPKFRPARDEIYAQLVRRFRHNDDFALLVRTVTRGLDLVVLDCDERHGLVVGSIDDSVFAVRMSDYARRIGGEHKASERVLHALAHLGAATLAYPRPADLANPAYVGRFTVNGVEAFIREAALRLHDAATEAGVDIDPPTDSPNLELAWRAYSRRASAPGSGDGRRVASSTVGMAAKALAFLADHGLLAKSSNDNGGTYTTTSRYRIHVKDAGDRMFGELLDLGITEVSDGDGSLTQITWTTQDVEAL